MPLLKPKSVARCLRCHAVLRRKRAEPFRGPLAFGIAGIALMAMVAVLPFMDLTVLGSTRDTTLITGPLALQQNGMLPLALLVLATTLLAPSARLLGLVWVLLGVRRPQPPRELAWVFGWVERLRPWSMVEVFLLGVFVAYTKLIDLARVEVGLACYAMGALMVAMAAADAMLDPEAVWEAIPPARPADDLPASQTSKSAPIGCPTCHQVSVGEKSCPRCGETLHRRKPHSLSRTAALVIAAACLYVPANILPVLTLVRLGRGEPSTILGGAQQLLAAGMWPLALLVFVASITVPVLKIVSLTTMLVATWRGSAWRLLDRTRLYRVVDFIGRWSMIDVFMISILTALVRLGFVAQVYPQPGVLAFAGVVIITMFAAATFDPRLMWDAAERRQSARAPRNRSVAAPAGQPA